MPTATVIAYAETEHLETEPDVRHMGLRYETPDGQRLSLIDDVPYLLDDRLMCNRVIYGGLCLCRMLEATESESEASDTEEIEAGTVTWEENNPTEFTFEPAEQHRETEPEP